MSGGPVFDDAHLLAAAMREMLQWKTRALNAEQELRAKTAFLDGVSKALVERMSTETPEQFVQSCDEHAVRIQAECDVLRLENALLKGHL